MKPTQPTKQGQTAEDQPTAESQTSTSSGVDRSVADSINGRIAENEELAKGHKMKKGKVGSTDYWTCQKCGFGTELDWQAEQHEAQPI